MERASITGGLALAVAALALPVGSARAEQPAVGVVTVAEARDPASFKGVARVAVAIRHALRARGRKVVDPAQVLQGKSAPLPGLALRASQKLVLATKLYDSLEFGKARAGFKEAANAQRQAVQYGSPSKDYIKALEYLAAAAFYDSDRPAAVKHFRELIAFAPRRKPDEAVFSPDVLKVYEEANAGRGKAGKIKLACNPGAEVYLNGRYAGVTPMVASKLMPAHYLVQFRSPGYEAVTQWIAVEPDGVAEVKTELKEGPQLSTYKHSLAVIKQELKQGRPGPTVTRLRTLLGAASLVFVLKRGVKMQATWAEGKYYVKRYQGKVAPGKEKGFAGKFMSSSAPVVARPGCTRSSQCSGNKQCQRGRCVTQSKSTPIYKKWWFWTIVGVAVVGGTVGAVVGSQPDQWDAQVVPGAGP